MINGFKKYMKCIQRGTTTLARAATPVMLDHTLDWWRREMINHLHKIRNICITGINEIPGLSLHKFEGTYVPLIKFDYDKNSKDMFEHLLREANIALSPGSNYGPKGEGFLRICIATSETIINETINRIESAIKSL